MDVARYWTKARGKATRPDGRAVPLECWGWSAATAQEAERRAREALERLRARVQRGDPFPGRYEYGSRPLREEVLSEATAEDGTVSLAVTRNAYGALVLNAARVMFVDVDDDPERGTARLLAALFPFLRRGRRRENGIADRLRDLASVEPALHARLYRTAAGHRILFAHRTFDPRADATRSLMERLGADANYVRLCRAQGSFRARLTPKPWRIGVENPPRRDPWTRPEKDAAMREWIAAYEREAAAYRVCRLEHEIGGGKPDGEVARALAIHDEIARVTHDLPLA